MSTVPAADADRPASRRRLAAAASLIAALALTFALVAPSFWQDGGGDVPLGIGLVRTEICFGSCVAGWLADENLGFAAGWPRIGIAALVAGAIAASAQVVLAIGALRGAVGPLYRPRIGAALGLFAFSLGAVFVVAAPAGLPPPGPALFAFFVGGAVAIAASATLHPRRG